MEQIIASQEDAYEKLEKAFKNYRKSPKERINIGYLQSRIENAEIEWSSFKAADVRITESVKKEKRKEIAYFANAAYENYEELFYLYKGELTEKMRQLSEVKVPKQQSDGRNSNDGSTLGTNTSNVSEIKLPRISIPCFSGDYTEWSSFHDLFCALIHSNKTLNSVQKLHYLKSNLKGDAEVLLRQFAITDDNYIEAWTVLKKRYDNKKYICNSIFKKFFEQKIVVNESALTVKNLLDTSMECITAMKNLKLSSLSDAMATYVVESKLDPESRMKWEEIKSNAAGDDYPTFDQLKSFLETRFRSLEMVQSASKNNKSIKPRSFHTTTTTSEEDVKCSFCNDNHYIFNCKKFISERVQERREFVKNNRLCFNCLIPNHTSFRCRHHTTCRICRRKHHSLLHENNITKGYGKDTKRDNAVESNKGESEIKVATHIAREEHPGQEVLLATALVDVEVKSGEKHILRALIDQGSEASFITARVVDLLGLNKIKVKGVVSGVGEENSFAINHMCKFEIKSKSGNNYTTEVKAYVLKSLTTRMPAKNIEIHANWFNFNNMKLADPTFDTPGRIDILLGADVFSKIIDSGLVRGPSGVIAQYTQLGWILSGEVTKGDRLSNISCLHITSYVSEDNNLLKKFWEIETEPYTKKKLLTDEEEICEHIYKQTTMRDETGRYVVHLPLKNSINDTVKACGNTKLQAITRFQHLERKFHNNQALKEEYAKVMQGYINLGYMRKVDDENNTNTVYLPHLAVIREDKDTTKVRVVFDASAKGSNGSSLNDTMMTGPTLQSDLRSLIIRWRSHKFCVIGDVVKMYLQVRMAEEHTELQRVVWRDNPEKEIESYKLLTVTFGTAAAPYLAVKTLMKVADDEGEKHPSAAAAIKECFYMDDLMTGHEDLPEIKQICKEIKDILRRGGFEMQKWSSNSEELLEYIKETEGIEQTKIIDKIEIKLDKMIKILGLTWNRKQDTFNITVNLPEVTYPVTKRSILSDVAKLFDPFGWLAPVIITSKVMIQKLWLCNHGWDDELPSEIVNEWIQYRKELTNLNSIQISRWIYTSSKCQSVELHGFADASSIAYAAVVYARTIDNNGEVNVTIIASKTKVAPLKQLTIPKLELCAAELLAQLLRDISHILNIDMSHIYAYSDSMVVLSWLQSQPSRWQVFVGNRVSKIIQAIDNDRWRHVKSGDNPADLASRGTQASLLVEQSLWWNGPDWLKNKGIEYNGLVIPQTDLEVKKKVFHIEVEESPIWERFSSFNRMRRVLAYCRRILKTKEDKPKYLLAEELDYITESCIKYYQRLVYKEEIEDLRKVGKVKNRSNLLTLTPFLDKNGMLRVGGRLGKANMTEEEKHPVIVPNNQHVTLLIINEAHIKTLHGGTSQMMAYIRSKYWIIRLKSAVSAVVRKCVVCIKDKAKATQQLMGQLPAPRVTPQRAFSNSGIDYAGPIEIRMSKGRGCKSSKGYICIFVCMSTRAIHLEAVSDLTAQAFIAAFRRFVARRGQCRHIWSDNATNFVGANKELMEMFNNRKTGVAVEITELLANDGIKWHFIPPRAPNFGGLWEAGVRSVKRHLTRINGSTKLTFEEMTTLLTQIEACLNSRPLSRLDDSIDSLTALTPGHFLVGEPLIGVPDDKLDQENTNRLTRWQLIQNRMQDFWKRWKSDYLNTLQQRYKWQQTQPSPGLGDIVIIKDNELPPTKWLLGKIVEVHPGSDNLVRVVTVQCKGNHYLKRPLSKVIPLSKNCNNVL